MLIQFGPLDGVPVSKQLPVLPLFGRAICQAGIPVKWNRDAVAIRQGYDQLFICYRHVDGYGLSLKHPSLA